jgi:riboflavin kinase/FMN adenylyltransferase
MEILKVRQKVFHRFKTPAVALGNFDGVHRGHRKILSELVRTARNSDSDAIVYTFDPHPRVVLNKAAEIPRITTFSERVEILEHLGVNVLILAQFTKEFAEQTPEEFAEHLLKEELGASAVFVGSNFRFGKGRSGDAKSLKEMGPELGFKTHVIPPVLVDGERVSSSRIRDSITKGDIRGANRLLGREFTIEGKVIHGHHRGKGLGFPTANIKPDPKIHPPSGVYAVYCRTWDGTYPGVMNIGLNPTFQDRKVSYETHILDYEMDLYGQKVKVYFVERLRSEKFFEGPTELKEQIAKDVSRARGILTVLPAIP